MKPGDLVRYKKFPHEELHDLGMMGLVLSAPYAHSMYKDMECAIQVDIWWDRPRSEAWGNDRLTWDFADELEVISKY